ncbi:MAG TPA: Clp protease [Holosporales bacterium]|nr:Clp protease [Holosporales bacterium]
MIKKSIQFLLSTIPFTYVLWVYLFKDTILLHWVTLIFVMLLLLKTVFFPNNKLRTQVWMVQIIFILISVAFLFILNPERLPYLYPVIISLSVASGFMYTLYKPPYMIETFMRFRKENLTQREVTYAKNLTIIWAFFSVANAGISLGSLWISMDFWILYNGLISYVLMGILFAGGLAYPYIKKIYD